MDLEYHECGQSDTTKVKRAQSRALTGSQRGYVQQACGKTRPACNPIYRTLFRIYTLSKKTQISIPAMPIGQHSHLSRTNQLGSSSSGVAHTADVAAFDRCQRAHMDEDEPQLLRAGAVATLTW